MGVWRGGDKTGLHIKDKFLDNVQRGQNESLGYHHVTIRIRHTNSTIYDPGIYSTAQGSNDSLITKSFTLTVFIFSYVDKKDVPL